MKKITVHNTIKYLLIGCIALGMSGPAAISPVQAQTAMTTSNTNYSVARQSGESDAEYKQRLRVILAVLSAQVQLAIANNAGGSDDDSDMNMSIDTQMAFTDGADLRVTINKAMQGHVGLGAAALRAVIDESPDTEEAVAALSENTDTLANLIGSVFGNAAEDQFDDLWEEHIDDFAAYAIAIREDDDDMQEEAEQDLEQYAEDIAEFFAGAMPATIDESTVVVGASEHRDLFFDIMDEWEDNDYDASYDAQIEAAAQIQGISDLLTKGILNKFPDKF